MKVLTRSRVQSWGIGFALAFFAVLWLVVMGWAWAEASDQERPDLTEVHSS